LATEKARLKSVADLTESFLKQNQDLNAKTEQEKLDLQKSRDLESINQIAKTENEKQNLLAGFNEKYIQLQADLDKKTAEATAVKVKEATDKRIETEDAQFLKLQELTTTRSEYEKLVLQQKLEEELIKAGENEALRTELKNKFIRDSIEIDVKANEEKLRVDTAYEDAKRSGLDTGLNILSQFAGKNKALALGILAIQKGLAIADVVVAASKSIAGQTAAIKLANSAALATPAAIASFGLSAVPVIAANTAMLAKGVITTKISAGTSIANILGTGLQSAKSISDGGGGGGSGGGGGGGSAPAPPQFNLVGQSSTNQLTSTIAGQQNRPVQTFVVGNQVSTQQSLDRNAVATSTFG